MAKRFIKVMIYDFYKNIVFTAWAEYSKFFADF